VRGHFFVNGLDGNAKGATRKLDPTNARFTKNPHLPPYLQLLQPPDPPNGTIVTFDGGEARPIVAKMWTIEWSDTNNPARNGMLRVGREVTDSGGVAALPFQPLAGVTGHPKKHYFRISEDGSDTNPCHVLIKHRP
jgi:hypothetical protein